MAPTQPIDSILLHPALAGRTLVVHHAGGWAAFEIEAGGRPAAGRLLEGDPAAEAWRGSPVR